MVKEKKKKEQEMVNKVEQESRLFKVSQVEGVGRVLVATEKIKAGQMVLRETAAVAGPANSPSPVCLNCCADWRPGGWLCRTCGWTLCGEECEGGRWHSIECQAGFSTAQGEDSSDFRGVAAPPFSCHKEPARQSKEPNGAFLALRWFFMA